MKDCLLLRHASPTRRKKAWAAFYAEYYPKITRYIASRVSSREDACDLTQDVFVEFFKSNGTRTPERYIFGIAGNLVARYHRDQRRQPSVVQAESPMTVSSDRGTVSPKQPGKQLLQLEIKQKLTAVVANLPPKAQEAIKLRFTTALSLGEASKKAGCSQDAFLKRVQRATKALAELIKTKGL